MTTPATPPQRERHRGRVAAAGRLIARTLLVGLGLLVLANAIWLAVTANRNLGMALAALLGVGLLAWGVRFDQFARHRVLQALAIGVLVGAVGMSSFLAIYGERDDATYTEDAIVVLGAAVHGRELSNTLASRLDAAADYHARNPTALIVVSGGQGPQEDVTEASAMREYLIARGLPPSAIVEENRSTSTEENFAFSKQILDARLAPGYRVAYVTNEFHVYRAGRIARSAGMIATHTHSSTPWYFWPTSYLRECLAVGASWAGISGT